MPSSSLTAALLRLEESRDRLLLAQTRMMMATEQAEQSLRVLASLVTPVDRHDHRNRRLDDPGSGPTS
jgi:hypothetical protein